MTLNYAQTAEDNIAFNYYYFWSRPSRKESRIVSSLLPLCFFFFIVFSKKGVAFERYGKAELYLLLFGAAMFFLMGRFVKWNNTRLVRNLIASGKNVDMIGNRTLLLEDNKLVVTTSHSRTETAWSALEKLEEAKDHFFLFIHTNQAYVIPKRIFSQVEEQDYFRKFVSERINVSQ